MAAKKRDQDMIRLSKSLAWLLRHGAAEAGVAMRDDGYVKVADVLRHSRFQRNTVEQVRLVVASNDKQRFALLEEGGELLIKANQGHSVALNSLELDEIKTAEALPVCVHGTYRKLWPDISKSGLSCMSRNHMHFAVGRFGDPGVTSGMRRDCNVFMYVDVAAAMAEGVQFFRSPNGVVLSAGVNGLMPMHLFARVVDGAGACLHDNARPAN